MQHEARLLEQSVFLGRVAPAARRDDVVPGVEAAATFRHDVVDVLSRSAAVLAAMAVAGEHCPPGDRHARLARNPNVLPEPDDGWLGEGSSLRVVLTSGAVQHLGLRAQDE